MIFLFFCYNLYLPEWDELVLGWIEKLGSDLLSIPSTALTVIGGDFYCTLDPSNDQTNSGLQVDLTSPSPGSSAL